MPKTVRREMVVFLLKQLNSLQIRLADLSAAEFPMRFKLWLIYRYTWHSQLRLQSPRSCRVFYAPGCLSTWKNWVLPQIRYPKSLKSLDSLILLPLFCATCVLEEESINAYETTGCFKNPFKWWVWSHCSVHCDSKIIEMLKATCLITGRKITNDCAVVQH